MSCKFSRKTVIGNLSLHQMSSSVYCRFCAQLKVASELAVTTSEDYQKILLEKLSFLDDKFVDFSTKDIPETVCVACYELINLSATFFLNVQKAQDILTEIFENKSINFIINSDNYGDIKCEFAEDSSEFPEPKVSNIEQKYSQSSQHLESKFPNSIAIIKYEPKTDTEDFSDAALSDIEQKDTQESDDINYEPQTDMKGNIKGTIDTWNDYPMSCKLCIEEAEDREQMRKHGVKKHGKCLTMQCVDCDDDVDTFEEFVKHVGEHRPHLRNICPYCNSTFDPDSNHMKQHTSNKFTCIICGSLYNTRASLRRHHRQLEPSPLIAPKVPYIKPTLKELTCSLCCKVMKTISSLKSHLFVIHGEKRKDYICDRCGNMFITKHRLEAHSVIHENVNRQECRICGKTFLTITRLKKHIKTHNLQMPFQCDNCKRFFNSKDRLREHMKSHSDILRYQCRYCPKKFKFNSLVKTHENQHTGARPYSCKFCSMDFANWSNCNKHMKRIHNSSLAKNVMTPHGKLALNPVTGKPDDVLLDVGVQEWSERMLRIRGRKTKGMIKSPG